MTRIISVANRKGGVGKTTTVFALGTGLTRRGYKVLFIDLDPQRNLSFSTNANYDTEKTIANVLFAKEDIKNVIQHTKSGDIAPASKALATADLHLTDIGYEHVLAEALKAIKGQYDYVLIDTPPTLSTLTINALTCSDSVIIPTRHDMYGVLAISDTMDTITNVRKYTNKGLTVDGILLTQRKARALLANEILNILKDITSALHTKVYKTTIRDTVAIQEAGGAKISMFDYAPKVSGVVDYEQFIEEFLKGVQK